MDTSMVTEEVPIINVDDLPAPGGAEEVAPAPKDEFSGNWNDLSKDLALIAKEQGAPVLDTQEPSPSLAAPVVEPEQPPALQGQPPAPVTPEQVTQEPEVPEKFRGADGKLDQEKVLKSYRAAERELHRLQNEKQNVTAPQSQAQVQPQAQAPVNPGVLPLELEIANDLMAQGIEAKAASAIARTQAKAMLTVHEDALRQAQAQYADLKMQHAEKLRADELEAIAKRDPWVMSPQGFETLNRIRQERPWVNQSPEPWREAYRQHLADKAMSQVPGGQVNMPTPSLKAPTAPIAPVVAASRVIGTPQVALNSPQDVLNHVKTLSPEQETEFWKKAGYKWR